MGLKVYKDCCKNCLLSPDRIVSPRRAKDLIKEIKAKQSYFICHEASIRDQDVVCKTFYDTLGYKSQMIRIAERLDMIEYIDQPDSEPLVPYNQMKNDKNNLTF